MEANYKKRKWRKSMIVQIELEKILWKFIKEYSYMFKDPYIRKYIKKNRERYVQYPAHVLGDYLFKNKVQASNVRDYFSSWMLDYFERQENFSMLLDRLEKKDKPHDENDFEILPDTSFLDEED
jgi:hypothetical protein